MTLHSTGSSEIDPLIDDYKALDELGLDWSPIPMLVRGKQLDEVHIREWENGPFLKEVIVGQANANRRHVLPPPRWNDHPIINYVAWRWFLDRCENLSASKAHQYTIELSDALKQLKIPYPESEEKFGNILRDWAREAFLKAPNDDAGHHRQTALRTFLAIGQLESDYGFDDSVSDCLRGLTTNNRITRGIHVLRLDDEFGPFTKAQRVQVQALLDCRKLNIFDEAMLRLHRFIGLRPLQTALLRESDLTCQEGIWHLNVPLIKGRYASGRRNPKRMRLYRINDDIAVSLQRLIASEEENQLICPISNKATTRPTKRPLFKANRIKERTLPRDKKDAEYYYHITPQLISSRFLHLTKELKLKTQEIDTKTGEIIYKPIRLCAYRFRYTVGTLLAQNGASLRQIALWLGHKGEESVRFYLNMAQEWWDHDFSISLSPKQQKAIAALNGVLVDKLPKSADGEIASCIAMTGRCVLPPGVEDCPYDPMKSCVGCMNRKDTTEMTEASRQLVAQAIAANEAEIEYWRANSTAKDPLGLLTEREKLVDSFDILSAWGLLDDG